MTLALLRDPLPVPLLPRRSGPAAHRGHHGQVGGGRLIPEHLSGPTMLGTTLLRATLLCAIGVVSYGVAKAPIYMLWMVVLAAPVGTVCAVVQLVTDRLRACQHRELAKLRRLPCSSSLAIPAQRADPMPVQGHPQRGRVTLDDVAAIARRHGGHLTVTALRRAVTLDPLFPPPLGVSSRGVLYAAAELAAWIELQTTPDVQPRFALATR